MTDLDEVLEWMKKSEEMNHGVAISDGGLGILIIDKDRKTLLSEYVIGGVPLAKGD